MIIRLVELRDLPALRDLFLSSRRAAFHWEPPSSFDLGDFDPETEGELRLAAFDGERLVGFISIWEPESFIHHLHVDPVLPLRGIGQALLAALPGWGVTRYQLKCVSTNEAALAFYRAKGFTQVGEGIAGDQSYFLLKSYAE